MLVAHHAASEGMDTAHVLLVEALERPGVTAYGQSGIAGLEGLGQSGLFQGQGRMQCQGG